MSGRYRVVGCSNCDHLWIVDGQQDADATRCPRCEYRYERARRRPLAAADDLAVVREHRTRLLAERAADLDGTGVGAIALDEDRPDYGMLEDHLQERFEADAACDEAFAAAHCDWTVETTPRIPSPREQLVADLVEERARARAAATRTDAELLRDRREDQPERARTDRTDGEPADAAVDEAADYTLTTTEQPPVGDLSIETTRGKV